MHRLLAEDSVDQRVLEILRVKADESNEYARRSDLNEVTPDAVDISDLAAFARAEVDWIPRQVHDLHGQDQARVKAYLDSYPARRDSTLRRSQPMGGLDWRSEERGMGLSVEWRDGTPLALADTKTLEGLAVARYRSANDTFVTPAIGSMATGLHPFLALWGVLLAMSSLARYEPATWSKMIDIGQSAEANPIEHLLEVALDSVPAAVFYLLTTFR